MGEHGLRPTSGEATGAEAPRQIEPPDFYGQMDRIDRMDRMDLRGF